jgi:hypothetical protein
MITKFVLIVWLGYGQNQVMSIETFDTQGECDSVADVLETTMDKGGWYKCVPYRFNTVEN